MAVPATVAYIWPTVVQPTAAQARQHNTCVAEVTFTNVDDTGVAIVHNMNLPNATGLKGIPKVSHQVISMGTVASAPICAFTDANTITVTKNTSAANTTAVFRITVERPAGLTR